MTSTNWAKLLRLAPLSAILATLTLGSAAAITLAAEGPIQNFNWLKDEALLDQALDAAHTKDDDGDDDDDDDDVESGDVIYQRRTTTTTTTTTVNQVSFSDIPPATGQQLVYRLSALRVVSGFPGGVFYRATISPKLSTPRWLPRPLTSLPPSSHDPAQCLQKLLGLQRHSKSLHHGLCRHHQRGF
jgi:hypothetical protein